MSFSDSHQMQSELQSPHEIEQSWSLFLNTYDRRAPCQNQWGQREQNMTLRFCTKKLRDERRDLERSCGGESLKNKLIRAGVALTEYVNRCEPCNS